MLFLISSNSTLTILTEQAIESNWVSIIIILKHHHDGDDIYKIRIMIIISMGLVLERERENESRWAKSILPSSPLMQLV